MKMDRRIDNKGLEVERASKQGAQELENREIEKAVASFTHAYKISRELNDEVTERACAFNLGAAFVAAHDPLKGLEFLSKAVPPENVKDGRSNGDLYFNFGLAYERRENYEEAVRHYKKALEEYKSEGDNSTLQSEVIILDKLCKIYIKTDNIHVIDAYNELEKRYQMMNQNEQRMEILCQKAMLMFKWEKREDAESLATECEKASELCQNSYKTGNIYNDLGLLYTQLQLYDRAQKCFELALPIVRSRNDQKQEAVVLQNLGAACNFTGDYERSITFHEKAAQLYAQLKNRNSQGQCYANLAFAHSQLHNMVAARDNFNHALLAAKDTSDYRSQWQVHEGLAAVEFNNGNFDAAVEHFKMALKQIKSKESDSSALDGQTRLVSKLTFALKAQLSKKPVTPTPVKDTVFHMSAPLQSRVPHQTAAPTHSTAPPASTDTQDSRSRPSGRFVPVNRPGTGRQFHKVARGFSTLSSTDAHGLEMSETLRPGAIEQSSDETGSDSDESSASSKPSQEEFKKKVLSADTMKESLTTSRSSSMTGTRRQDKKIRTTTPLLEKKDSSPESSSESSEESSTSDDDDNNDPEAQAVKEQMRKLQNEADSDDESSSSSSSDSEQAETEPKQKLSMEPPSESSSSESESDSDEDEKDDTVPDLPTSGPPPTTSMIANTYENPWDSKKHPPEQELTRHISYSDIDFQTNPKQGEENNQKPNPNFFTDDSSDEAQEPPQTYGSGPYENMTPKLRTHSRNSAEGSKGTADHDEDKKSTTSQNQDTAFKSEFDDDENDPTYQSINPRDMAKDGFDEGTSGMGSFSDLPRGEREKILHEKHQELVKRRQEKAEVQSSEKESKTCIVM